MLYHRVNDINEVALQNSLASLKLQIVLLFQRPANGSWDSFSVLTTCLQRGGGRTSRHLAVGPRTHAVVPCSFQFRVVSSLRATSRAAPGCGGWCIRLIHGFCMLLP